MEKRITFAGVNSIMFHQRFKTDDDCMEYLSGVKWENGFSCKKFNNDKYCAGKKLFNRRCTKCWYVQIIYHYPWPGLFLLLKLPLGAAP